LKKNDNSLTPFILLLVVESLGLRNCGSYLDEIFYGWDQEVELNNLREAFDKLACVETKLSWLVGENSFCLISLF